MKKKEIDDYSTGIPVHIINSLAKAILPDVKSFYDSKEGQEFYREWIAKHKSKKDNSKKNG